ARAEDTLRSNLGRPREGAWRQGIAGGVDVVAIRRGLSGTAGVAGHVDHHITGVGVRRRPIELIASRAGAFSGGIAGEAVLYVLQREAGGAGGGGGEIGRASCRER